MVALTGFGFAEPEQKPDQVGMLCIAPIAEGDKSSLRQSVVNEEVGPKKQFRDYFPDTKNPAEEGFSKSAKTTTSIQPFVKFECKSSPVRSESMFLEANVSWEVKARSGWFVYSRDGEAKEEGLDQEAATVTRTVKTHLDQRTGKILFSIAPNEDDDHWGSATFLQTTVENDPEDVKAMTCLRAQAIHPCKRVASYPFEVRFIKASEIAFDTDAEASEKANLVPPEPGFEKKQAIRHLVRDSSVGLPSEKIKIIEKYLSGPAYDEAMDILFKQLSFHDRLHALVLPKKIKMGPVRRRSIHRLVLRTSPTTENAIKMVTILNDNGFEDSDYQAIQAAIDVKSRSMQTIRQDRKTAFKSFVRTLNQACKRWEFREKPFW